MSGGYCARTCGRAPCPGIPWASSCTDVPPGPNYTCAQEQGFGKCSDMVLVDYGYCLRVSERGCCELWLHVLACCISLLVHPARM